MNGEIDTALFFADNWDCRWRRRQQLAWGLAKSGLVGQVVYIERPLTVPSLFKFFIRNADWDATVRWRRVFAKHSCALPVEKEISLLTPFAPLSVVSFKPIFKMSEWIRDACTHSLLRKYVHAGRTLVCVSHPQISREMLESIRPSLLWYDCTEDFTAWPGLPDCVRSQVEKTDQWLTQKADMITTVSRILYEEKLQRNPRTFWLPNAVDCALFSQTQKFPAPPRELANASRPIITFVGGMCEWAHDWELLHRVASLRPQWSMVLIGDLSVSSGTRAMLAEHKNIILTGQKPYQELPAYLACSDACFIFYRLIRKNNSGNSQKLFLYLAAGKPTVSTSSADVLAYRDFVEIADTPEAFVLGVEKAIRDNTPRLVEKRQKFACENSWPKRIETLCQLLTELSTVKNVGRGVNDAHR